jgi:hypothetical protein
MCRVVESSRWCSLTLATGMAAPTRLVSERARVTRSRAPQATLEIEGGSFASVPCGYSDCLQEQRACQEGVPAALLFAADVAWKDGAVDPSERVTWEACPMCGRPAAVGWLGRAPIGSDCPFGCRPSGAAVRGFTLGDRSQPAPPGGDG